MYLCVCAPVSTCVQVLSKARQGHQDCLEWSHVFVSEHTLLTAVPFLQPQPHPPPPPFKKCFLLNILFKWLNSHRALQECDQWLWGHFSPFKSLCPTGVRWEVRVKALHVKSGLACGPACLPERCCHCAHVTSSDGVKNPPLQCSLEVTVYPRQQIRPLLNVICATDHKIMSMSQWDFQDSILRWQETGPLKVNSVLETQQQAFLNTEH